MLVFLIFFIIFTTTIQANQEDLDCPFKWKKNTTRNCEKSEGYRQYLNERPWYKTTRPDIIVENATEAELQQIEFCCYDIGCLISCGCGEKCQQSMSIIPMFPERQAEAVVKHYPEFFKVYNPEDFPLIGNYTANGTMRSNWVARFKHLDNMLQASGRKRMEDEIKAGNRLDFDGILKLILLTIGLIY